MNQSSEFIVVFTTAGSAEQARTLAQALVDQRLAACVTITAAQSIYIWNGTRQCDTEQVLMIKSRRELFARIEQTIRALHTYAVPELIALPIVAAAADYAQWILENTRPDA